MGGVDDRLERIEAKIDQSIRDVGEYQRATENRLTMLEAVSERTSKVAGWWAGIASGTVAGVLVSLVTFWLSKH